MNKATKERIRYKREMRQLWRDLDPVWRWELRFELRSRRPFRHDLERALSRDRVHAHVLDHTYYDRINLPR